MAPLIILVATTIVVIVVSRTLVSRWRPWPNAVKFGVVAMFTVTGVSHFVGMREALIDMIPPALPFPGLIVAVTGALELAGAVALLWHRTSVLGSAGLTLMLIAMFPANVYWALTASSLPADDQLLPRTLMQVVFIAATSIVLWHELRGRSRHERRINGASDTTQTADHSAAFTREAKSSLPAPD